MTQIEGLDQIGEQVAQIDLDGQPESTQGNETVITLVTDDGEVDITDVVTNASNDFEDEVREAVVAHLPHANGELFDPGSYVDVPVVDGQATDKLVFGFGGSLPFEASDSFAQSLFNRLQLGASVTLQVEVQVVKKDGAYKVNAKEEETITGGARLKVTSLYVKSPEEL